MPKSAAFSENDTTSATIHSSVNGMNEAQLKGFVAEIEDEQLAIDKIMEDAKAACQPRTDRIKEIYREAAEAGIPKKAFRAFNRMRGLTRKAEQCRETLNENQQSFFDEISMKVQDLPLFKNLDS